MLLYEEEIQRMRKEGQTRREIAKELGLNKVQIKNFINRHNRRQRAGIKMPKRKGRPRKRPITTSEEMTLKVKELEREVALLRSFLHAAGRM